MGTVHLNGYNRVVGRPRSKAEIRAGHVSSLPEPGGRMHEFWLSGPSRDVIYAFSPPLKVPPGKGLLAAQWQPSEHTIASWHWREKASTEPAPATPFGNMTVYGGLAAAFDGVLSKPYLQSAACEINPSGGAFVGQEYSISPKAIARALLYPTSDEGFDGNDGTLTFELYGGHTEPAHSVDGTLLGSLAGQADITSGFRDVVSLDQATAWEFVWVRFFSADAGNHHYAFAQAVFVEASS